MRRLSEATLAEVRAGVAIPGYDRRATSIGVVHFGPGAFHRVHQAWYFDRLLARDPRWGICAVSLRSPHVRDALAPQDGLYTLATLDATRELTIVGALRELLVAPESPEAVLRRLAAPQTQLVTLTITEKGYCLAADGTLDLAHPGIAHDLREPGSPVTAIGFLVEGLRRRRAAGMRPFTVVSCDNLVDNGARLAGAVTRLAATRDRELAAWIEAETAFPRTMVDSITPATTDALRTMVSAGIGLQDHWPVQREAFVQWVIEARFSSEVPDWASAGVTLTDDVPAYDRAKLRLLNGAHSTLAYVGLLAGYETVAEAIADPLLAAFARRMMWDDVMPTLEAPRGLDLPSYADSILRRFRNDAIRHELAQIAWDGSQKLPIRVLGTIRDALETGRPLHRLCVPVAAWMHFVRRAARRGERVVDPLADRLFELGRACRGSAAHDVPLFLALTSVFPAALAADPRFAAALRDAYARLEAPPRALPERLAETLA